MIELYCGIWMNKDLLMFPFCTNPTLGAKSHHFLLSLYPLLKSDPLYLRCIFAPSGISFPFLPNHGSHTNKHHYFSVLKLIVFFGTGYAS